MITASTYAMVVVPLVMLALGVGAVLMSNASTRNFDRAIVAARAEAADDRMDAGGATNKSGSAKRSRSDTKRGITVSAGGAFVAVDTPDPNRVEIERTRRSYVLRGIVKAEKPKKSNV